MITPKLILLYILQYNNVGISPNNIDIEQAYCLAINVYHESRSENVVGQFAVAHTTLTRVKDTRYPNTICGVVKQTKEMREDVPYLPAINKCQFSWYCDGKPDIIKVVDISESGSQLVKVNAEAFEVASVVALMAMSNMHKDNTESATHYYNYNVVTPYWAQYYTVTAQYGNHVFLRREDGSIK